MTHEVFSELAGDGARVTVRLDQSHPIGTYTVHLDGGPPAGRVDFVDSPDEEDERIVFHTEVDPEHGGRGLAGVLVREVLADSIRTGITVVPVCPLFARHLAKHGDEFVREGGTFRKPTKADIALAMRAARRPGEA